jgi:hypothetical protein
MITASSADMGWISMSRSLPDHSLVGFGQPVKPEDPSRGAYSRAEAWLDILCLASWKNGTTIFNKGRKESLLTGQLMAGYSWLAKRWNWSVKTVRNFLAKLIGENMVSKSEAVETTAKKGNQTQILNVCNYSDYQVSGDSEGQAKGKRGASEGQESNKVNKIPPSEDSSPQRALPIEAEPKSQRAKAALAVNSDFKTPEETFGLFWEKYPRKVGKPNAFTSWKRLRLEDQRAAYRTLLRRKDWLAEQKERGFCPHPSTWLNQRRWEDEEPVSSARAVNGHHHAKPSVDELWLDRQIADATRDGLLV